MADFMKAVSNRREELKLDKWGLPSVMIRELDGDEREQITVTVHANKEDMPEDELWRLIASMGMIDGVGKRLCENPDDLKKGKDPSAIKYIAKKIMAMYDSDEEAEKN